MIIKNPDVRLRILAEEIKDYSAVIDPGFHAFDALEKLTEKGTGVLGIAANQLGYRGKWFLFLDIDADYYDIAVNPRILESYKPYHQEIEQCLSLPGESHMVTRPYAIDVTYNSLRQGFTRINARFEGLSAQIFCHEMDHLMGRLISDANREKVS